MKKFVAAGLLAALSACGSRAGPRVEAVTIYQPDDAHFVRTIAFDPRTDRMRMTSLGLSADYTVRSFPAPPLAALRWVQDHGGFNQPIQTMQASEIVGVQIAVANESPIETRFASAWDVHEPSALKAVQSWYQSVIYSAATAAVGWHAALAAAIRSGRVRQIRFMPATYTLVIDRNGSVRIALRHGRRIQYARGRVDGRALASVYRAALLLSPKVPVYDANDPPTHVEIIAQGRQFTAVGSNDIGLELFAARVDQLAHDVKWSRRLSF